MKQPELGRKISELRKAKGLTQEELVEKCNINVRTIQRIETGEVTPRSYTVKTILTALDYDLEKMADKDPGMLTTKSGALRNLLLIDIDLNKPSGFIKRQLRIAWIFGIVYFVLGFLEGAVEFTRVSGDELLFGGTAYVIIKALVLIAYIFFQRGFIMIGGLFQNYLLKIVSIVLIGINVLIIGYDIASIFYDAFKREIVLIGASISYGSIGIIYGIALTRLEGSLGSFAKLAGILEIIAACCFISVILFLVGFIVLIPAELFEIILIFKVIEIIKAKEESPNLAG